MTRQRQRRRSQVRATRDRRCDGRLLMCVLADTLAVARAQACWTRRWTAATRR
jgi:hypothetical protein